MKTPDQKDLKLGTLVVSTLYQSLKIFGSKDQESGLLPADQKLCWNAAGVTPNYIKLALICISTECAFLVVVTA